MPRKQVRYAVVGLGHIAQGLALARQHHLPADIQAIIAEHHGTLPLVEPPTAGSEGPVEDAMRYFHVDPDSPDGARKRPRFDAFLRPHPNGVTLKRDPYFRDQFRRVLETGERPKLGVDMWAALGQVKCPLLVIRGSRSDMFAADTIPKVTAANPHLTLVEVDAGHDVAGDNPAGFLREVRSFLETQEIRGGVRGDETVRQGVAPTGD